MHSAFDSAIGLPRSSTSAFSMLLFLIPAEVRRSFTGPFVRLRARSGEANAGLLGGADATDGPVLHARRLEVLVQVLHERRRDGGQEATRRLRIVGEGDELGQDVGCDRQRGGDESS